MEEVGREPEEFNKNTRTRSTVNPPQSYVQEEGDVIAIPRLNSHRIITPQLNNMCVTAVMEYADRAAFGGDRNEGTFVLYYQMRFGESVVEDGVSLSHIHTFVYHFFKTSLNFKTYQEAIDAHMVVMTDIPSTIINSSHCVLVVGYKKNGDVIFMDPEMGDWQTVDPSYILKHYNIGLKGIKY